MDVISINQILKPKEKGGIYFTEYYSDRGLDQAAVIIGQPDKQFIGVG